MLFTSVHQKKKSVQFLNIFIRYLIATKDKFYIHMSSIFMFKRLCCWCCSTSTGKYVIYATNMSVECGGTKIASGCSTSPTLSCMLLFSKSRWCEPSETATSVWTQLYVIMQERG